MDELLSSHHRDALEKIFRHPASGNIEWREVLSLLKYLGTTTEEHNGKFKVTLGPKLKCSRHRVETTSMSRRSSTCAECSDRRASHREIEHRRPTNAAAIMGMGGGASPLNLSRPGARRPGRAHPAERRGRCGQPSRPNVVTSDIDGLDGSLNNTSQRRPEAPETSLESSVAVRLPWMSRRWVPTVIKGDPKCSNVRRIVRFINQIRLRVALFGVAD